MRRNWNWYNAVPEATYDRYTALYANSTLEEVEMQKGNKPKLKRLGRIQYRRSNMSKGNYGLFLYFSIFTIHIRNVFGKMFKGKNDVSLMICISGVTQWKR